MNLFRELRQNPVFLREAGFEFTPRVLGVSSGLAKVALVAGLMIFLVLFTASQAGRFQNVYFAMAMCATLLSPILALIVMISAPRGIRMRGGVSSIANLMVSRFLRRLSRKECYSVRVFRSSSAAFVITSSVPRCSR
jgi:hypothetical protein